MLRSRHLVEQFKQGAERNGFVQRESHVANMIITGVKCRNTENLLRLIKIDNSSLNYEETYDETYEAANRLFAFNRTENVIITSDKSWYSKNLTSSNSLKSDIPYEEGHNLYQESTLMSNEPFNNNAKKFPGVSPRGWLIIAACAVVGAIALYLALGAAGAIAGGVVGSGVGYLTNLAVDKCFGEQQTKAA